MFGMRIVLGINEENDGFFAIQSRGKIVRDKVFVYRSIEEEEDESLTPDHSFSAWRLIEYEQGIDNWKSYDGFDLFKVQSNYDGLERDSCDTCPDRDSCDDCDCEEECEEEEECDNCRM